MITYLSAALLAWGLLHGHAKPPACVTPAMITLMAGDDAVDYIGADLEIVQTNMNLLAGKYNHAEIDHIRFIIKSAPANTTAILFFYNGCLAQEQTVGN